jgi:hypothetical protein
LLQRWQLNNFVSLAARTFWSAAFPVFAVSSWSSFL